MIVRPLLKMVCVVQEAHAPVQTRAIPIAAKKRFMIDPFKRVCRQNRRQADLDNSFWVVVALGACAGKLSSNPSISH